MKHLIDEYSLIYVQAYMSFIMKNAEENVWETLYNISIANNMNPVDTIKAEDYMDDGTLISLSLTIDRINRTADFDFSESGFEVLANINAPWAITYSAIIYCLRCLVKSDIPLN